MTSKKRLNPDHELRIIKEEKKEIKENINKRKSNNIIDDNNYNKNDNYKKRIIIYYYYNKTLQQISRKRKQNVEHQLDEINIGMNRIYINPKTLQFYRKLGPEDVPIPDTSIDLYKNLGRINEETRILIMQFCQFHEIHCCKQLNKYYNKHFNYHALYQPNIIQNWSLNNNNNNNNFATLYRIFMDAIVQPTVFNKLKVIDLRNFHFHTNDIKLLSSTKLHFPISLQLLQYDFMDQLFIRFNKIDTIKVYNAYNNLDQILLDCFRNNTKHVHIIEKDDISIYRDYFTKVNNEHFSNNNNNTLQTITISTNMSQKDSIKILQEKINTSKLKDQTSMKSLESIHIYFNNNNDEHNNITILYDTLLCF